VTVSRRAALIRRRVRAPLALALAGLAFTIACSGSGHTSAGPTPHGTATTAAAVAARAPVRSAGCDAPTAVASGVTNTTISSGGRERSYQLDIPPSYDGKTPYPIVFGLHPLSVTYLVMPAQIGFADMEKKYAFIGVAPSGLVDGATPYWFAAPVADNYDVTFISDLLDHLEATLCVDTSRVFSTGISNGAQMSSLLGCRLAGRITAVAPVEGEEFLAPCDGAPEPILAFHGTKDPILPYTGGGLNATNIANIDYWKGKVPPGLPAPLGIDASMALWAKHNGCDATPTEVRIASDVVKRMWSGCKAATVLYIIEGGGHGWPGKPVPSMEAAFGHTTTSIDATNLVFEFFFGH